MTAPIDFVIPWVDGSDPAWQAQKGKFMPQAPESPAIDVGENRYRDWDNLQYWFRGVEKYASWVNKIHFITWGHLPPWLNKNAPKLHVVRHEDFIPAEFLPTFSANPIELNMHRIPGLSEQFVYFNDDFFLTAPVKPEDFFQKGLPRDSLSEEPMEFPRAELFNDILINDLAFVNRHFDRRQARRAHPGKWFSPASSHDSMKNLLLTLLRNRYFFGLSYQHLPQPFLKSTLEAVWQAEPALLAETCSHKFRDARDVNQYVFKFWQLLTGAFRPYDVRRAGLAFSGDYDPKKAAEAILLGQYKMICINDTCTDFETAKNTVNNVFSQVFPDKSSFEI